jgi:hypothetical protein
MVNKSRICKVASAGLAVGVLAVAGLGAGTASADDGSRPGNAPAAQGIRPDQRPGAGQQQGGPMPGVRVQPGVPGLQRGPQGGPAANRPAMQQPGARPAQAPNAANNQAAVRAKGVITAAAEVMAITPESVLAGLEQGQTLTQVAASHGLSRAFFLSELVSQIEKDIKDGQRLGIPASANLQSQLASVIDEPGLGIRGAALSNLF